MDTIDINVPADHNVGKASRRSRRDIGLAEFERL